MYLLYRFVQILASKMVSDNELEYVVIIFYNI